MRKLLVAGMAAAIAVLALTAPAASAKEKLLTLYSPRIDSLPYVHDTHNVPLLKADGNAPSEPGYIPVSRRWRWSTPRTPRPSRCRSRR